MAETTLLDGTITANKYSEATIFGMAGFTLSSAAMFIMAFSPLLETENTSTPVIHGITHGCMFLAMAVFYFIISRHITGRDSFVRSRSFRCIFTVLQLLLPTAWLSESILGFTIPLTPLILLWLTLGVSNAYFSCTWADVQSTIGEDRVRNVHLWSFGIAGCIAAAILAMPTTTGVISLCLLCIVSSMLLLYTPSHAIEEVSERDEKWFAENSKYSINGSLIMIADGMMVGVISGLLIARISKGILPPFVMGLAIICVALIFFLLNKNNPSLLGLGKSQLIFSPVLIGCLFLAGFLQAPFNTIASLPLFIILYLFDYTNSSVLSLRGNILDMSPCYCFSKGRVFIISGQAIGWFGGAFLASDLGHGSLPVVTFIFVLFACTYITATVIRPDKHSPSYDGMVDQAEQPNTEHPNTASTEPPLIERPFKRKCSQTITTYDLTPREGEILFFLAKGRNAKYIAGQLYVAERTIKTHTYHIYQKMGIHSQQELIDIIESEETN